MPIDLGPFVVHQRLAAGGMGQVWSGAHRASGTPVAIKLVGKGLEDEAEAVRSEVAMMAGLDHPHVGWVFDHGTVDGPAAAALQQLDARAPGQGSPWIAMELLTGGTLRDVAQTITWAQVATVVDQTLSALAHCHARGILHRDLKPTNLLFGARKDARSGLKLVDFGIAVRDQWPSGASSAGTPAYCAPEQMEEDGAEGPWTDLYALGVIVWRLASGGRAPFPKSKQGPPLYHAKRTEDLLPFLPLDGVPAELEAWLRCCMAGDPTSRFQCAADARVAFAEMSHQAAPLETVWRPVFTSTQVVELQAGIEGEKREAPPPAHPIEADTVWLAPPRLRDAGVGLWMHRPFALAGREGVLVHLWDALVKTFESGMPVARVVHGAAGTGRSRVLRELRIRAGERSGARVFGLQGRGDRAVSRFLASLETAGGLRGLDLHMPAAQDAWAAWKDGGDGLGVVMEVVREVARKRPVVVTLDDIDASDELAQLFDRLQQLAFPVLVVASCRQADMADPDVLPPLRPLQGRDLRRAIDAVAPLTPETLFEISEASAGFPRRARHLLLTAFQEERWKHTPSGYQVELSVQPRPGVESTPLLAMLALEGRAWDDEALSGAAEELEDLEARGLVWRNGGYGGFAAGVREAVLHQVSAADVRGLHRGLARLLPPERPETSLHAALSLSASKPQARLRAFDRFLQALEIVDRASDMADLLVWSKRGLDTWLELGHAPDDAHWGEIAVKHLVAQASLALPSAQTVGRELYETALEHGLTESARMLRVHLEDTTAAGLLDASLAREPRCQAVALRLLSALMMRRGELAMARHFLERCTRVEPDSTGLVEGLGLLSQARLLAMDGAFEQASAVAEKALRVYPYGGTAEVDAGQYAVLGADVQTARDHFLRSIARGSARADGRGAAIAALGLGHTELIKGDLQRAVQMLDDSRRLYGHRRGTYDNSSGASLEIPLLVTRNREEEARGLLEPFVAGLSWPTPLALHGLGLAVERARDPAPFRAARERVEAIREVWTTMVTAAESAPVQGAAERR